jgi:hypothetical protein
MKTNMKHEKNIINIYAIPYVVKRKRKVKKEEGGRGASETGSRNTAKLYTGSMCGAGFVFSSASMK